MLLEDLACSSCLRRLASWCLSNGITFKEDGQPLAPDLEAILQKAYSAFLRQAIIVMYMCGFIPWFTVKENGIPVPKVVPIGSFTWSVEIDDEENYMSHRTKTGNSATLSQKSQKNTYSPESTNDRKRKRKMTVPYYKIHMINTEIEAEHVNITNFIEPSLISSCQIFSPVWTLFDRHCMLKEVRALLRMTTIHNQCKHVMVSEEVELKNPNTAGIQLLDEFRRYAISGAHNTLLSSALTRLRARDNTTLDSVNDATIKWMQDTFAEEPQLKAHVLPPNTTLTELNSVAIDEYMRTFEYEYMQYVHLFFDLPVAIVNQSSTDKSKHSQHLLSDEQYTNIKALCDILMFVATEAYGKCFNTARAQVKLTARPRLTINSVDDLKTLAEGGVMTMADLRQMRKKFLLD